MTIITYPASYAEARRNLAVNPRGVATGTAWVAESASGAVNPAYLTGDGAGFGTYMQIRRTSTAAGESWIRLSKGAVRVEPGAAYTLSAWLNASGTVQVERLWIFFYDQSGAVLSETRGGDDIARDVWQRTSVTAVAPAGAWTAKMSVGLAESVTNDILRATGVLFEKSATMGEYFDGSMTATPLRQFSWAGTPNASESIESAPVAADRVDPVMILGPWRVSRDTRRVRHLLLDSGEYLYTFKPATLGGGVLELLFTSYAEAVSAVGKFSRDVFWQLYEQIGTDPTPVDMLFAVDEGELEIEQSGDSRAPFLVRVPWKEL